VKREQTINRRTFLALAGGTGAGFMMGSPERQIEKLIPYVTAPDYPKPGEWVHMLTTYRECPADLMADSLRKSEPDVLYELSFRGTGHEPVLERVVPVKYRKYILLYLRNGIAP
jgi:hypothetical protein